MYQATRIFASNLGAKKAERFYKLVLLPRVREDIWKNKCLHFALYQSLKKCLYKPAAFFKGILFPLCEVHIPHHSWLPNFDSLIFFFLPACGVDIQYLYFFFLGLWHRWKVILMQFFFLFMNSPELAIWGKLLLLEASYKRFQFHFFIQGLFLFYQDF